MNGKYSEIGLALSLFAIVMGLPAMAIAQQNQPSDGQAQAGILMLACTGDSNNSAEDENVWINTSQSSVTEVLGPAYSNAMATYPAQITATAISWLRGRNDVATVNAAIDRTTGTLTVVVNDTRPGPANISSTHTKTCSKGSIPFPATKF